MNLVAIGSQLFGFAVLMLFDFLKSFQNAPFCTITCKDFDKISGKTRFQACQLENSLNRRKRKNLVLIMMWLLIILAATMNSREMLHYEWALALDSYALCSLLVSSKSLLDSKYKWAHWLFVCFWSDKQIFVSCLCIRPIWVVSSCPPKTMIGLNKL